MDITHTIRIDEDGSSLNMVHFWLSTSYVLFMDIQYNLDARNIWRAFTFVTGNFNENYEDKGEGY